MSFVIVLYGTEEYTQPVFRNRRIPAAVTALVIMQAVHLIVIWAYTDTILLPHGIKRLGSRAAMIIPAAVILILPLGDAGRSVPMPDLAPCCDTFASEA